jgi:hypothetical protein
VKDFMLQPEVSYTNWDAINNDQWSGLLRAERVF